MLPVLALDRARVLLSAGLVTEADRTLADAVRRLGAQRVGQDLAEAHLERAAAALVARRPGPAAAHARRASGILARRGNPRWAARARLVALRADLARGGAAARSVAEAALGLREELDLFGLGEQARMAGVLAARATCGRRSRRRRARTNARELLSQNRPRAGDRLDMRLAWRLAHGGAGGRGRRLDGCPPTRGPTVSTTCTRPGPGWVRPSCAAVCRCTAATSAASGWSCAVAEGRAAGVLAWSERARAQALLLPPVLPPHDPRVAAWLTELRAVDVALAARRDEGAPLEDLPARRDDLHRRLREHAWSASGVATRRPGPGSARCGPCSAMPCCSPSCRSAAGSARWSSTPAPPSWSTSGRSGRSSRRCAACSPTSTPRSAAPCRPGWRMPWPPPPRATPPCSTACCSGRCSATSGTGPSSSCPPGCSSRCRGGCCRPPGGGRSPSPRRPPAGSLPGRR